MHLTIIKQQFKQDIWLYGIKTHFAFFSLLFYSLITPLPSWPKPLFQSEAKYEAIDIKMSWILILLQRLQITIIFTKKALKVGVYGTRKWPIPERIKNSPTCNLDFNVRSARAVVASRVLQVISLALLFIFFLKMTTDTHSQAMQNSAILQSSTYTHFTLTFFCLSLSAYFSASRTMFSISSLLNPPEDWITTETKPRKYPHWK